jgi:monoamine oxidase
VLEARDRLGGRMFTGGDDNVIEFGAQWIQVSDCKLKKNNST